MNIHEAVGAVMKVTEEEMMAANAPIAPEAPVAAEPVVAERPEITPELIDSLIADMPELADCDKEMLIKGVTSEMEHFDTVGGDVAIVARIACDHIKEFAGKDYYAALDVMEHELQEAPGAEQAEHAPGGEEAAGEVPAGEEATETPKVESPFESKKEPKDDELSAMKKEANKKAEDKINKEAAEKK